ncbi:MAG TPA: hypothetical protein VFM73_05675 [Xanthomonadaceae bacterium]|nr:hypothetical protein [Xanthomonadaceae bacterium]
MPLEELGLLQALEKITGRADLVLDRFARYGLAQGGLITDEDPPRLTERGVARLEELRQARDAGAMTNP